MRSLANKFMEFGTHLYREHPQIVLFILMSCCATLYAGTHIYAQASTVENQFEDINGRFTQQINMLERKLDSLQSDITEAKRQQRQYQQENTRNFLLIEINSMEREIYQLEQAIDSGNATGRDRDRLVQVRSDYNEALRQLSALPVPGP